MPMATAMMIALTAMAQQPTSGTPGPVVYQTNWRLQHVPAMYRDSSNAITNVHESTHGLNSMLRQRYAGRACFYLGEGHFAIVPMLTAPTLGQVGSRVRYRGRVASTYLDQARLPLTPTPISFGGQMVMQEGHERNPLFLFDELSAYTNGAEVASRYRGGYAYELTHALELAHYAATLWWMIPANSTSKAELGRLWYMQSDRLLRLYRMGTQYEAAQAGWVSELVRERNRMRPYLLRR